MTPARVDLGEVAVGELTPASPSGETAFTLAKRYLANPRRQVLGRVFEDSEAPSFHGKPLPPFFQNLLPEGALRKIVEGALGAVPNRDYAMLLRLGGDLPGAVRVAADSFGEGPADAASPFGPYRFALTGVQAKLALSDDQNRLTVPFAGEEGAWIAKFGSPSYTELVRNEHAMLTWAERSGLVVPEHRIVRGTSIEHLPEEFDGDQDVLLVRRYDRVAGRVGAKARIHQEDFAQVFDVPPAWKYAPEILELDWVHHAAIGGVVHGLCGADDFLEYLKRVAFSVLCGNADAHLKNWALFYPDGLHARLTPLYDVVATVAYPSIQRNLALRLLPADAPTVDPGPDLASVTFDDLLAVASFTEGGGTLEVVPRSAPAGEDEVADALEAFVAHARATWKAMAPEVPDLVRRAVDAHLANAKL